MFRTFQFIHEIYFCSNVFLLNPHIIVAIVVVPSHFYKYGSFYQAQAGFFARAQLYLYVPGVSSGRGYLSRSAIYTRVFENIAKCKVVLHYCDGRFSTLCACASTSTAQKMFFILQRCLILQFCRFTIYFCDVFHFQLETSL